MTQICLNFDAWMELLNLEDGTFAPLKGFQNHADYRSVLDHLCLREGAAWSVPITLDVCPEDLNALKNQEWAELTIKDGTVVGSIEIEEIYQVDIAADLIKLFGTSDKSHPGVAKEIARSPYRVAGRTKLLQKPPADFAEYALGPEQTRAEFKKRGWKKIVGFQTRNPPHLAHEYLQRVGLEVCDGVFIQPLIGWKKSGDFTPDAVVKGYIHLIENYYPSLRAVLGTLRTPMRYAGPKEAVFHAIVRRNHGCTHFIVGRDHAGVGNFYDKYEAQRLAQNVKDLGIEILSLAGPFFCFKCNSIATENSCKHSDKNVLPISGTDIRTALKELKIPPTTMMREDVSNVLIKLSRDNQLFVP